MLGSVARTLHARPYLTREAIRDAILDPEFAYLAGTTDTPASDLADEIELVKFTPIPFSLEELSKLWSVLLQTTYLRPVHGLPGYRGADRGGRDAAAGAASARASH